MLAELVVVASGQSKSKDWRQVIFCKGDGHVLRAELLQARFVGFVTALS